MLYRISLWILCVGLLLTSCGTVRDPATTALETFTNALIKEQYDDAVEVLIPYEDGDLSRARKDMVDIRSALIRDYGILKGAVISEINLAEKAAIVTWQLEEADLQMVIALEELEDKTVKVMPIPFMGRAGRLSAENVFATLTPLPTATPNAEQLQRTAETQAMHATSTARTIEREAIYQAEMATATTVAMHATATELARPPETYLTARQAFLQAKLRNTAAAWSDDAMLIALTASKNFRFSGQSMLARDGTSRLWFYLFASPNLEKTMWLIVQDGVILEQSDNDAALYKEIFAGRGEPFDLRLEEHLDSDQAFTIARENGTKVDTPRDVVFSLSIYPGGELRQEPPGVWSLSKSAFLGSYFIRMDGITGEIIKNDFGPTGSPGAVPTPIAPVGSSTTAIATPTATPQPSADDEAVLQSAIDVLFEGYATEIIEIARSIDGTVVELLVISEKSDPLTYYLHKQGDTWDILTTSAGFPPNREALQAAGVPEDLLPESFEP